MRAAITAIRPPLVDNYTRIIQSLARSGRNAYHAHLVEPLSRWTAPSAPAETMPQILVLIEKAKDGRSRKLPLLYKMAIIRSVAPDQLDLSIPGNISLGFLRAMKQDERVMASDEALEFMNLLKDSFKEFSDREFVKMNRKFEEEIAGADTVEVEKLIRAREGEDEEHRRKDEQAREAAEEIRAIAAGADMPEIKRRIIVFLLAYADPSMPNRHLAIDGTIAALERRHSRLRREVMDSAAVIIYHEILKAIRGHDLAKAVAYIGKYAVLFRGDPGTPNFREVDSFEKKFFQIIEERNLWERLRG